MNLTGPINFYTACPTRPVECVAYSSGVGPEDRIGVKFIAGEERGVFNQGNKLDKPNKLNKHNKPNKLNPGDRFV